VLGSQTGKGHWVLMIWMHWPVAGSQQAPGLGQGG